MLKQGEMIEEVKLRLSVEENSHLHPINCFLSSNNNKYSLISCIELPGKGAITEHIEVIDSFNLLNSAK